ncbi:MAG: hypothetical protein HYW07_05695 [Candidatus Latescibacteria bacterium]|nr:hypothetical protein [Candidatus Latescibacterota bacterium]
MAETLGTKDVLEQVDARLGNVEQDLRGLRSEMNSRFDRVYQELGGLREEIRDLRNSVDHRFIGMYGLLVAVLLGVAGLWFK